MASNATTICLYGRSGSGKTTQIGVLAEEVFRKTGKKTRLYTVDRGGLGPIQPYIDLGIVEVVGVESMDPWAFLTMAVRGRTRNESGGWNSSDTEKIGLVAFESLRGFGESMQGALIAKAAKGINIGGGSNVSFQVTEDGETIKIGGTNQAHYGIIQSRIAMEVRESFKLPVQYVLWTSSVSRDEDPNAQGVAVGPDVIGKALTTDVPRWFHYTFRIDALPSRKPGQQATHVLHLGTAVDPAAKSAVGLSNPRMPLDAKVEKLIVEPANLVTALDLIDAAREDATVTIRNRLNQGGRKV